MFGVRIETAVDSDEVTPTDKMEWHDDLGPVLVTNFTQLQVLCLLVALLAKACY